MNSFKWSKILGVLGLAIGVVQALVFGITWPIEILGYSLPYFIVLLLIGLLVDFIIGQKKTTEK